MFIGDFLERLEFMFVDMQNERRKRKFSVDLYRQSIDPNKLNDLWRAFEACRIRHTFSSRENFRTRWIFSHLDRMKTQEKQMKTKRHSMTVESILHNLTQMNNSHFNTLSMLTGRRRGRWCRCCIVSRWCFGSWFCFVCSMFLITHPRIDFFMLWRIARIEVVQWRRTFHWTRFWRRSWNRYTRNGRRRRHSWDRTHFWFNIHLWWAIAMNPVVVRIIVD